MNVKCRSISTVLSAAAFGDDPGRWPLPAAQSPTQLWLRAVAAAGQGRYSIARTDLVALVRPDVVVRPDVMGCHERTGPLRSLAFSARASFLRQLGCHRLARGWDGRALALAQTAQGEPLAVEASADALIGLAADALGMGRLAASAALLARAEAICPADGPPRMAIRLAWVSAELAMAGADGEAAVRHAERGIELAERALPALRRHWVKSRVVLAAGLCSHGELQRSRAVGDAALVDALSNGLVPLQWALACLLADIGSATHAPHVLTDIRADCADTITRRGGQWSAG